MKHNLDDAVLMKTVHQSVYKLRQEGLLNEYLIVSGDGTRRLMASPEVVGFGSYQSMVPATMKGMQYLAESGLSKNVNILCFYTAGLLTNPRKSVIILRIKVSLIFWTYDGIGQKQMNERKRIV